MQIGASNIQSIPLVNEIEMLGNLELDFLELYVGRSETTLDQVERERERIADMLALKGLEVVGHVTNYPAQEWNYRVDLLTGCLDLFAELGAKLATIHPRVEEIEVAPLQKKVDNMMALQETLDVCLNRAEEHGMMLCFENTSEPVEDLVRLFNNLPGLGLTLDVGHANLNTEENKSLAILDSLGSRLRHVHCHDNRGGIGQTSDLHLPIGAGDIAFEPIFGKLRSVGYDDRMSLEILTDDRKMDLDFSRGIIQEMWKKSAPFD
ncbi:MAG: sugar phosphate isomerase/epimerase [Methanomassiliicoccales archaeon]|nr:MAG: sugar phosphate isomerase/epimerase [Methanomassiliicoccales archaeon]